MKKVLICGAGGFVGTNLSRRLKEQGHRVMGVDLRFPEHSDFNSDIFAICDLRDRDVVSELAEHEFDEVYQLAALMGGARFSFTGLHDADIIHDSAMINLNVCDAFKNTKAKIFFSSSACMYPERLQYVNGKMKESNAWDGKPDSIYGIEKLFSEHLYESFNRNYGLDIRIARFHNIFGERSSFIGGKEKAPASFCRQIIESDGTINIFGDGSQKRSFLYIEDCLDAIQLLMNSDFRKPINIGSEESVSINDFVALIIDISGKDITINHIPRTEEIGLGVQERNSDNALIEKELGWKPKRSLREGLKNTYKWIELQLNKDRVTKKTKERIGA